MNMNDKHITDLTIEQQSNHIEEGEDLTFEELLSVVGGLAAGAKTAISCAGKCSSAA